MNRPIVTVIVETFKADLQKAITEAEKDVMTDWDADPEVVRHVMGYVLAAISNHIPELPVDQFTYFEPFSNNPESATPKNHNTPQSTLKIHPTFFQAVDLHGDSEVDMTDPYAVLESCDSAAAVLTDKQIAEWLAEFNALVLDPETAENCDFHTATLVFDIDGEKLVLAVESGGPAAGDLFEFFCAQRNIPCQYIIDNPLFEGVEVDNMYTGASEDHYDILALVHRLTN